MTDVKESAPKAPGIVTQRLQHVGNVLGVGGAAGASNDKPAIRFEPDSESFPKRKDLPQIPRAPAGAAWFWGEDDNLGRLNLLTPKRVLAASKEIKTGELVPLNLPLDVPKHPAFEREQFQHHIKCLAENLAYDDLYTMNTQSGTQWDGFRHFSHLATGSFYNNTHGADIMGPNANDKCSIHYWSDHGIAGRGVLLDYWGYAKASGITYDPYTAHRITYTELARCGKAQGIDIRPAVEGGDIRIGDILLIRSGFVDAYWSKPDEERKAGALREQKFGPDDGQRWAGVAQEEEMLDWLHNCYFAGVAGDAPSFEAWPSEQSYYLHEYLLALWGCPLGELWDLEKLARRCRETGRWTFFMTSSPANMQAGVGSHANAIAIL